MYTFGIELQVVCVLAREARDDKVRSLLRGISNTRNSKKEKPGIALLPTVLAG